LPHFHQLNSKILHGLQGTVQLSLVSEETYQNRAVGGSLDVQPDRLQRSDECIGELSAHADLIRQALSAPSHRLAAAA
jgi:hypothetical protein